MLNNSESTVHSVPAILLTEIITFQSELLYKNPYRPNLERREKIN